MRLSPQKQRELLFLLLYATQFGTTEQEELIEVVASELHVEKEHVISAFEQLRRISLLNEELDAKISALSTNYELERIQSVERIILRLALYELYHKPEELAIEIIISEAMRLARKFASAEAAGFINALLDKSCRQAKEKTQEEQ